MYCCFLRKLGRNWLDHGKEELVELLAKGAILFDGSIEGDLVGLALNRDGRRAVDHVLVGEFYLDGNRIGIDIDDERVVLEDDCAKEIMFGKCGKWTNPLEREDA